MKKHIALITLLSCFALPVKAGMVENEIIFMLDASGSLYDANYANWNAMLDWTSAAMQATIGEENAHGLGIFSGGRSSLTLENVAQQGNMNMHYGLHDGALDPYLDSPINGSQDANDKLTFVAGLDNSDFVNGYSWTDEALNMARISFINSPNHSSSNKFLFLLTDGRGATTGHEHVKPEDQYISPTVQALLEDDVTIVSVLFGNYNQNDIDRSIFLSGEENVFLGTDFGSVQDVLERTTVGNVPAPASVWMLLLGLMVLARFKRA